MCCVCPDSLFFFLLFLFVTHGLIVTGNEKTKIMKKAAEAEI